MFSPLLAGQNLTAALVDTAFDNTDLTKALTSDLTSSSVTFQDAAELTTAVAANAAYIITCQIVYDSSTTADISIRFTAPTATLIRMAPWGPTTAITTAGTISALSATATDSTATATMNFGGGGAGSFMMARPSGLISVNTASGNLVMGFAQVTASGSTLLKVGTMFKLTRIF